MFSCLTHILFEHISNLTALGWFSSDKTNIIKTQCTLYALQINRGSYMSAHVILNLFKEFKKRDQM